MSAPDASALPPPVLILSPGRSFSTVVSAMLGRHPSLCALPETCLLARESMAEYTRDLNAGLFDVGLIYAVQELIFGEQSENAQRKVSEWLAARRNESTLSVFDELRRQALPRIIVEKSPAMTTTLANLERIDRSFEGRARYIHLTRHPLSYGTSLLDTLRSRLDSFPPIVTLRALQHPDSLFFDAMDMETGIVDPQRCWLRRHTTIDSFVSRIDPDRHIRVRGEDFVNAPDRTLEHVTAWLRLPTDAKSLDDMLHPEHWGFSNPRATGNGIAGDRKFFANPNIRNKDTRGASLDGALRWRWDGRGFDDAVRYLAASYGYQ
ncbi:MAG TPA: sulfotransferase [Candidatus Acidoferrum sp.]|nr:sulfotransferase [Candidatus Acidoferrum sp.]